MVHYAGHLLIETHYYVSKQALVCCSVYSGAEPACWHCLQALRQLIGELHDCPRVSLVITSRIKPVTGNVLELPPLDEDSAVKLLRRHCGSQSGALQPESASKLVRLCGCNALLLQVLGAMIRSGRCRLEVRARVAGWLGLLLVQLFRCCGS